MWKCICIMLIGLVTFPENAVESIIVVRQAFTIEGGTSVGDFSCTYELDQRDTVKINSLLTENASVQYIIPSTAFGCHNFLLNRDFKKTIKAKEYKDIRVVLSGFRKTGNHYTCNLKLRLAGKEKMYEETPLKTSGDGLTGSLVVQFSEFDLTPPKRMGGLVKVKEDIKISVALTVQQ